MKKNTKSPNIPNVKGKAKEKKRAKKNNRKKIKSINGKDCLSNYIRVRTDYYKIIRIKNRFGYYEIKFIKWTRQELLVDFEKFALKHIERYDGFYMEPNNLSHTESKDGFYNLYAPFPHVPKKGEWKNIRKFLKHIFREQYELGIQYFQALYLHPNKILPILVLVSKSRQTGKTTFIDLVMAIFAGNAIMINSEVINGNFNSSYASKQIIAVDEAGTDKSNASEKYKHLSTAKSLLVNGKFEQPYTIDFYGKLIIASNKEQSFLKIDFEEIRYFIRKIKKPKKLKTELFSQMLKEIPAFLYYLKNDMPELDWSNSRQLFTPEQLNNSNLNQVVEESYSYVYKELKESLGEFFNNTNESGLESIQASTTDIKERLFPVDNKISRPDIKKALQEEFKFKYDGVLCKYKPFDHGQAKTGRPWTIEKKYFT